MKHIFTKHYRWLVGVGQQLLSSLCLVLHAIDQSFTFRAIAEEKIRNRMKELEERANEQLQSF